MKILYIGGGYVGACSAAVSADNGHEVLVYDINEELIKKLSLFDGKIIESAIHEAGLGEIIIRNRERINFVSDLAAVEKFIDDASAVFICLPTPEKESSGETDLSYYEKGCRDLAGALTKRSGGGQNNYILIVNKSTVPIDMYNRTKEILDSYGARNYGVGSCPEFLVEGEAIKNLIKPDRIIVGAWQEKDFLIFRDIYKRYVSSSDIEYIEVNPIEAATAKLLANYVLFSRLAVCFNVVGRACEKFNYLNYENIRKTIVSDKRIGDWGFYNSLSAGGSCFIKDTRSLLYQLGQKGEGGSLIGDVLDANFAQLDNFMARPERELNYNWQNKRVGLLGLAFKKNTNDIRNSPAIGAVEFLLKKGVKEIKVYDPAASRNFLEFFAAKNEKEKIILVENEKEAMSDSDVLIIATEWPQFSELAEAIINNLPEHSLIMDGRRMLNAKYKLLSDANYDIIAVGSPLINNKTISIIVPIYGKKSMAANFFDSLLIQTYKKYEIIVVNDSPTARAQEMLKKYEEKFKIEEIEFKIIDQRGEGEQAARNRGFKESKGEYVLFLDTDTVPEPRMLELMLHTLKNNPTASYAYSSFLFGKKLFKLWDFDLGKLKQMPCIHMSSLIRREHLPQGGFDESIDNLQDWDLWLAMLAEGHSGVWADEVLYKIYPKGVVGDWLPSFAYKLLPFLSKVKKYESAVEKVKKKHGLLK